MLSRQERAARQDFYAEIFGEERFRNGVIFKQHLWPISTYQEKIAGLTERGFTNPQKLVTSFPAIIGLSFENIDGKIAGLKDRGFTNPQKMITLLPSIIGLSLENIDRKLKFCRRLKVDVEAFIAYSSVFIAMSHKRYIPIARKCRDMNKEPLPKNVFAIYKAKTF